jgi:hypothetical protein
MQTIKVITSGERARRIVEDPAKYFADVRVEVAEQMLRRYPPVPAPAPRVGIWARLRRVWAR